MVFDVEKSLISAKTVIIDLSMSLFLQAYPNSIRELCLKMYLNGLGFRAIARIMNICHSTIIEWVKKVSQNLPTEIMDDEIPEITEIDELQTFVGSKKR